MLSVFKNIIFANPWYFVLMLIPIWYFYTRIKDRKVASFTVSSDERLPSTDIVGRLSWVPSLLESLVLALIVVAMARPQLPLQEQSVNGEGIDIMLVMDLSGSMLADDFAPNRLEVSKEVATEFVGKRLHDRIGLTVFSKEAFTQSPLTTDYEILKKYIAGLQVGLLSDGTAIGMGLATALNRIIDSDAKSKIAILLTDGENTTGYIDPLTAAEIAKEYEIKVYTIGIGSDRSAQIPTGRFGSTFSFGVGKTALDEDLLIEIAELTNGQYFRAKDKDGLRQIYNTIDQLEKSEIEINVYKRFADQYRMFIWSALIVFLIALLIDRLVFNPLD